MRVIDNRTGQAREMAERYARILIRMGKVRVAEVEPSAQEYLTRDMQAEKPRRGRPPKAKLDDQADEE